jgi:hypothetical protein
VVSFGGKESTTSSQRGFLQFLHPPGVEVETKVSGFRASPKNAGRHQRRSR